MKIFQVQGWINFEGADDLILTADEQQMLEAFKKAYDDNDAIFHSFRLVIWENGVIVSNQKFDYGEVYNFLKENKMH